MKKNSLKELQSSIVGERELKSPRQINPIGRVHLQIQAILQISLIGQLIMERFGNRITRANISNFGRWSGRFILSSTGCTPHGDRRVFGCTLFRGYHSADVQHSKRTAWVRVEDERSSIQRRPIHLRDRGCITSKNLPTNGRVAWLAEHQQSAAVGRMRKSIRFN